MTKLVAFADAHFGAGDQYGSQPGERLKDQRTALEMVVDTAIEWNADALLFGGDAFEGPIVTPEQYDAFRQPLMRLAETGIQAVGISGNGRHDCATRSVNALEIVGDVMQVHRQPAVVEIGGMYVALLPWASTARLIAARNGGDRDESHAVAGQLLLQIARDLYARVPAGARSMLLGHWSLTGAHLPNGLPVEELREPVIDTDALEQIGFDLCVFGHIHVPGPVGDHTLYTGPLTTTSFGEADVEHGCWKLEFSADVFDGMEWEFVPLAERPFVTVDCDLTTSRHEELDLDETEAVAAAIVTHAPLDDAVIRIRYRASEEQARRINWPNLRILLADCHKVYSIQGEIVRSTRARVETADEDVSPLEAVRMWAETQTLDGRQADSLAELTGRYLEVVS